MKIDPLVRPKGMSFKGSAVAAVCASVLLWCDRRRRSVPSWTGGMLRFHLPVKHEAVINDFFFVVEIWIKVNLAV